MLYPDFKLKAPGHSQQCQARNFWAHTDNCRKQAWVLKKYVSRASFPLRVRVAEFFFSVRLSSSGQNRCCRAAEEPHKSLDVLGYRCQEELLPHKLQSAQAQATQSDLVLEFRE